VLTFPGATSDEFVLMTLFNPARRENMIAWMAARCDEGHYGDIILYKFPKQRVIYGPAQIDAYINQDTEISRQLTLWNQQGSSVHWGAQLVIPIDRSLIYVKPLYIESTKANAGLPQMQRVVVVYGTHVAMRENLDAAVAAAFSAEPAGTAASPPTTTTATSTTPAPPPSASNETPEALIKEARAHFDRAQQHLREGDWAGYGEEQKKLDETLKKMEAQTPRSER
jgi:uncharacterized membrane protein (UPF0182 family)